MDDIWKELLWSRFVREGKCWRWTGPLTSQGYGVVYLPAMTRALLLEDWPPHIQVHRLVWILTQGPITDRRCVCHRCDVRACGKPEHLFLGTYRDNIRDMISKGRARHGGKAPSIARQAYEHRRLRGRRFGAKLTRATAQEIRVAMQDPTRTQHEVASAYEVSRSLVSRIVSGERWPDKKG